MEQARRLSRSKTQGGIDLEQRFSIRRSSKLRVFDKFKGSEDNKFNETFLLLDGDAKGLLSLYEAAHLRTRGEEILEEAVDFTVHHLKHMVQQLDSPLQDQVKRALEQPFHLGVPRIETRCYISSYEKDDTKNELLLKLAKLDFNYVQNMHKTELHEVSRWWNELDLKSKLPHTRDRVVEAYLWAVAFHFEPQYSKARVAFTKALMMLTVIDNTYDNYATVEEAELFTEIMERWNIDEIDRLPDYMKIIYRLILSVYEDYEREAAEQGKSFAVPYAKETVNLICRAYNKELKWIVGQQRPTYYEYLANTLHISCIYVVTTTIIPGMKSVSNECIDWLTSNPKIFTVAAKLGRYLDDLSTHERDSKQGQMVTGADIYMKQHGVSMEETIYEFVKLAADAWKDVNAEWMTNKTNCVVPKDMLEHVLNFARMSEITYKNCQDGFTHPEKTYAPWIRALFVDPIII
ncbi:gamma-cadinene synthase [Phtheirospermum japonicum]|uniref:Gamma-cadinene synthase n=1 Tax=Phtheirospermum japonicum TaxID=374723 RepID=A0A830CPZ9_9LAMI|nr:gamma-cadinene synthase [Phtheirospermum japonicum]